MARADVERLDFFGLRWILTGAQEGTRTPTVSPPLGPEPSASTNSATWATGSLQPAILLFGPFLVKEARHLQVHKIQIDVVGEAGHALARASQSERLGA